MCIAADELSQCDAVSVASRCDWERAAVEPKRSEDATLYILGPAEVIGLVGRVGRVERRLYKGPQAARTGDKR